MNFTLSKIKKNEQGTNSGGDESEIQINDLENKEEKKHSIRTARRKKKFFKKGYNKKPLGNLQTYQHPNHRGARRKRERIRN